MQRPSRRKLILLAAVAAPCLLLGGLWLTRASLGVWAVTDYLRRQGAPAKITITRLTADGFSGSAVIGPAQNPDLVIGRIEADYALFPDLRFAPRVGAVTLSGVRLKAGFDGKRLQVGTLQKLVDQALAKPSGGPAPKIRFDDTIVRLATPAGGVILTGQGLLDNGRVQTLSLAAAAPRLTHGALSAANVRGALTAQGGARLAAQLTLTADTAQAGQTAAKSLTLRAGADLPYGRNPKSAFDGPATLDASLQMATLAAGAWTAQGLAARSDLAGVLAGGLAAPRYNGRASLALAAQQAGDRATTLTRPGLTLATEAAALSVSQAGLAANAPVTARASADGGIVRAGGRAVNLRAIALRAVGPAQVSPGGFSADLSGSGLASGVLSAGDARALADQLAPAGALPVTNAALRRALAAWRLDAPAYRVTLDNGPAVVRLLRPARAAFDGGAVTLSAGAGPLASVTPGGTAGALRLALAGAGLPDLNLNVGRYRLNAAGLNAAAHLDAKGDLPPLEGLQLAADLTLAPQRRDSVVRLAACAPLTLAALRAGPERLLSDVKAEVCPAATPLAVAGPGRWRAAAQLRETRFIAPAGPAAVTDGRVDVRLAGAGAGKPTGEFTVTAGRLTDQTAPARFTPLLLAGGFSMANDRVDGRLGLTLAARSGELAGLRVTHDIPTGQGRAMLDPTRLTFAADGLQPADLAPAAAPFLSRVSGGVGVEGEVNWGAVGVTGSGRAVLDGLDASVAGGRLTGVRGTVVAPELMPILVIAPDQRLTAARFESAVPLTDIELRFGLDGEALRIAGARASLAKGAIALDALTLPLKPGGTSTGVVRASGVDLGEIISSLNLSESVTMDARVDANLPFSITPQGLRFANGRIAATAPGRLSIKRTALTGVATGAATAQADAPGAPVSTPVPTNAVQDFAYQALENLAFTAMDATVDSRPMGRLGVVFHVKGASDPPKPQRARIGVLDLARGTAFDKPIPLPSGTPVDLTLDTSLNFDDLMAAYGRMSRSDAVQP